MKNLPFAFDEGKCANVGDDSVMLCGKTKSCHLFDGDNFHKAASFKEEHWKGAMATYQDGAVVIAGNANNEGSLEHYNPTLNQWTLESKTKAFHFYERFTAVPLDGTIYTFGGQIYGGDYVKDIYKMGSDFKFSKISQKLNERRSGHRSLVFKNQVIHVGGKYEQNIEI